MTTSMSSEAVWKNSKSRKEKDNQGNKKNKVYKVSYRFLVITKSKADEEKKIQKKSRKPYLHYKYFI